MSRCFPYPPPGYVRNPVAAAEAESTAKLQKEREKAEKKKEKRSDKKALQHGEASKHSKHSHKKRKHEDVSTVGQESKGKESVEQLEKSGLSEEHGAPCFIQTVRDSPESSQDSSKRRKVVLPSPSQAKNGNILRIKIKSNQDSTGALTEKPRVLEQPLVQQMGSGSSQFSKQGSMQQNSRANVQPLSAAPQRMNGVSQAVQKRVITDAPAKILPKVPPQPASKAPKQVNPQLSVKASVGRADLAPPKGLGSVEPSPVRSMGRVDSPPVKLTQKVQHPPAKVLPKIDALLPAEEIQRKGPAVQKEIRSPAVRPPLPVQPALLQKTKESPAIKLQQEPLASLSKEEPCTSGRNAGVAPLHEEKQSRSDRKKSRKAEKKEKKFRDLFVTWIPPSFEMECSDVGEQDWLLGSTRNSDASTVSCRASDGSVPFHSMEQQPTLQPRATFLPDLNIYQLPYVVPF